MAKEEQEKSKGTFCRRATIIGVTIFCVISIILGILVLLTRTGVVNKTKDIITDPELARAMTYEQFEDGDDNVEGTDNVKFSAFFLRDINGDGYAEKVKGTCKEVGKEDTIYMELNVLTEGKITNGKIEINGENFYLQTALPKDEQLKESYIGNNIKVIEFNDIANGTQKMLTGIVRSGDYTYSSSKTSAIGNNINNYSRNDNKIVLTGTYVAEDGSEAEIRKEINLAMDWYGTTKASITSTSQTSYNLPSRIDEENQKINLGFSIRTLETKNELILSKNYVEGEIPQLNGFDPIEVSCSSGNVDFTYDEETHKFTITRIATVDENGKVKTGVSKDNTYSINVSYPIEAYNSIGADSVTIKIPVSTYFEGYNNPNAEFKNPYTSNIANSTIIATYSNPKGSVAKFKVTVGKYMLRPYSRYVVSKQKPLNIYNGISTEEKNDLYTVRWYAVTGTDGESSGIVMKETRNYMAQEQDKFIKTNASEDSMENITTNRGIGFSGAQNLLKEDGWIKVYDEETNNLLVTFDKNNWNKYTESNPYYYDVPVKHIRIETSETKANSEIYIYNIKELDDEYITQNYTKEEFDNLSYIKSNLTGYLGGNYINTDTAQATYEAPYSIATIALSKDVLSTQITEEHDKIMITANADSSYNQVGWKDGSFLVKLPEEIIDAKINSISIDNLNVEVKSYELLEQNNIKLIKINTKNIDETTQTFSITIDCNLSPDPRITTVTRTIELYASNEEVSDYYYSAEDIYDVNDNLNVVEKVNKASASINLVAPNSLLISQTASEYDDKNSEVVSPQIADIRPQYAVVDGEENTAKIGIDLKNNYSSTISELKLIGVIPFEGNKYVISNRDLNSTFTTKMTDAGLTVPEELQGKVVVYYSEVESPTNDLEDEENGWKTADEVNNWDNIKTFMVDFQDYVLASGKSVRFEYTIKISNGLDFNVLSYSEAGVYFNLDTQEGKYRTKTEPNKLGFRIAEKYNLVLEKYQTGKDKLVPGATYMITKQGDEEGKTAVTNADGKLEIKNLYAEETYIIEEIKVPEEYELSTDVLKFIGHVDEDGILTIEKLEGTTRENIAVTKEEGDDYKASVKVEDEAKANLKITKLEFGAETKVKGIRYQLTGTGLPESGKNVTTNIAGEINIKGLKIGEEYTLTETKAEGYYLASQIKFKVVNDEGIHRLEILEGDTKESSITEENEIPTINLELEDERIPTYTLEITKKEKGAEKVLEGAKFKLYKGSKEIGDYTTDSEGKIEIEGLYQYVEGKPLTKDDVTYTLKEVLAPDGYAKVQDITFIVEKAEEATLQFKEISENYQEAREYEVEENTIKLIIEDSPSFKLVKKDGETNALLPNVKFAIYDVEDGEKPARNSKGEIIGTKEIINGREYYTVVTDENGEITADLPEGLYKAVEVEAEEKYDIKSKKG